MQNHGLVAGSTGRIVRFGDIVRNASLTEPNPVAAGIERVVGLDHIDPGDLHIRRWNSVAEGTSFTRRFVPGQTLFGKRRAYQRKVAFAEFEGICSGDILTFEPKDPKILLLELLPFICQTDAFFEHALGTSAGSLSPRTSWKALQDFEFPLPPLDRQKRIAEILWAVDSSVQAFHTLIASIATLRKATVDTRILRFDDRHGSPTRLTDWLEIESGQVDPKKEPYRSMPLIAPDHIEQGTGRLIAIKSAAEQKAISGKYTFRKGDVVFSKIRPNLRKASIAETDGLCSADMYALRPNPRQVDARILIAVLLSDRFASFASIHSVRTVIPRLNRKELAEFRIALPPIYEQMVIAQALEDIDHVSEQATQHALNLRALSNSLLAQYLKVTNVH